MKRLLVLILVLTLGYGYDCLGMKRAGEGSPKQLSALAPAPYLQFKSIQPTVVGLSGIPTYNMNSVYMQFENRIIALENSMNNISRRIIDACFESLLAFRWREKVLGFENAEKDIQVQVSRGLISEQQGRRTLEARQIAQDKDYEQSEFAVLKARQYMLKGELQKQELNWKAFEKTVLERQAQQNVQPQSMPTAQQPQPTPTEAPVPMTPAPQTPASSAFSGDIEGGEDQ